MRFLLSLCLVMGISALHAEPRNAEKKATDNIPLKLWYNTPARYFEEALPIGNGKIGAMVYSGGETDSLQLNDITLWSGKPVNHEDDREAHKWLPKIREALFREDYAAADSLQLHIQGHNSSYYMPLGTLYIEDLNAHHPMTNYHRELSIDSAICRVSRSEEHTSELQSRQYLVCR